MEELKAEMLKIYEESKLVGLAAQQLGRPEKLILVMGKFYEDPVILHYSDKTDIQVEGCWSFPDTWVPVERSLSILTNYGPFEGFEARVFQHEVDHLNHITMLERSHALK